MATTKDPLARPSGSTQKWSMGQGMKWIKASVRAGNIQFSRHARFDSFVDHNISDEDAKNAILRGRPIRWESGVAPKTKDPCMKLTFEQKLNSRSVSVVAAIDDEDPNVVVVTVWDDKL